MEGSAMGEAVQTWQELQGRCVGRYVIMFGAGLLSADFFANTELKLSMVVDNDIRKQGKHITDFLGDCADGRGVTDDALIIQKPDAIKNLLDEKPVVVIACRRAEMVRQQLSELGAEESYSIVTLNGNGSAGRAAAADSAEICENKIAVEMAVHGGHGYYITKALLELRHDLDIVWIVSNHRQQLLDGVRCVYESNRTQLLQEMNTAKVWVIDGLVPEYVNKKKEQLYLQVKHWSSVTLKKFYMGDIRYTEQKRHRDVSRHNAEMIDYIVSGSDFDEESCRVGFAYHGKFLRMGSPRSDILFDPDEKKRVKDRLGLKGNAALYAPTWRDSDWTPDLDHALVLDALRERFGGDWVLMVKLHPSVPVTASLADDTGAVLDMSTCENAQELVAASDVVITDYSSIMFEPAYVGKPTFLYASDREAYVNRERDLLIDYDTLPFPLAGTNDALRDNILRFDEKKYRGDVDAFLKKYGVAEDGHASERVAKWILDAIR